MPKVSELTGTPWHVEKLTRNEGDERRHKSRCIYYRKKDSYCKYQYIECIGSRYCKYYKAKESEKVSTDAEAPLNKKDAIEKISDTEGKKLYPIGSEIRHQKFGEGYITEISDGHITIDFKDAGKKILALDVCVAKGYLEIIKIPAIPEKEKAEVIEVMAASEDKIDQPQTAERITDKKSKLGWLGRLFSALFKRGK